MENTAIAYLLSLLGSHDVLMLALAGILLRILGHIHHHRLAARADIRGPSLIFRAMTLHMKPADLALPHNYTLNLMSLNRASISRNKSM